MKHKELIIFGKVSSGLEIYEVAETHYKNDFEYITTSLFNDTFINDNKLDNKLNNPDYEINYIIGFSDFKQRKKCVEFMSRYSNVIAASIINPTAYIAKSAKIGNGCYVGANSTVSTNAVLNEHVFINLNATVGHDSILEEHVIVSPGARISGNVKIGEGSLIGAGCFIHQGVTLGKENMVDALTYVRNDLPDRMVSSSRSPKPFKRLF